MVLFCVAVIARGRFLMSQQGNLALDPDSYGRVAWNLASNGMFGVGDWPTAWRPPLFPCVLAAGYRAALIAGLDAHTLADFVAAPWHLLAGAVAIWGTWRLGRLWRLPPIVGLAAAGLVTVDPILLQQSAQLMTETTATALAVLALIAWTQLTATSSSKWALATGALVGLCVLCRPEYLVWFIAALAAFVFLVKQPQCLRRVALVGAAAAVVVSPWAIRNLIVFDQPILTTTHGGHTLLLGNNPRFYEYLRRGAWGSVWDSEELRSDWREAMKRGDTEGVPPVEVIRSPWGHRPNELAVDRWAYRQAFKHIRTEPAMFAYSCLVRVGRLWAVLPHQTSDDESPTRRGMRYAVGIWYAFELALAAIGAWVLRGQLLKHPWLWATLLVLSLTLVHAFYWTDMRMRAPLMPVVALAAAYGALVLAYGRRAVSAGCQAA